MGGWVLKRFMTKLFESGFTINRCAVDGLASRGISCEAFASFPSALAVLIKIVIIVMALFPGMVNLLLPLCPRCGNRSGG
jgi:hypothetical protein